MKKIETADLTLFIFSVLFLLLFAGAYVIYSIYYLPYFNNHMEYYIMSSEKELPSKLQLLFGGFRSFRLILNAVLVATFLVLISQKLNFFNKSKKSILQILYTAFSWTTIFAALFTISNFIWFRVSDNFITSFSLDLIREQLPFLLVFYFITIFPLTCILYKK